jgi:hypothetical protein
MENYYYDIQKIHEGEDYCTYSFKTKRDGEDEKVGEMEVIGKGRFLIDALGNALLKESFQKFEK